MGLFWAQSCSYRQNVFARFSVLAQTQPAQATPDSLQKLKVQFELKIFIADYQTVTF
ncbi:hypothetical protein SAMN04515668_1426 [Hymenobacter arizonensis]|uniref:Uncharacterized protein n=1 Tax=Hymenobacter arizonensis TaxID=1227077 RepID=A0A1I5WPH2_HYMAR|nr:hypothetical protein SAMN04515668_1426 [Hymenobacter arizonensis]